ncbi:hypothetical protein KIW84_023686 [Lathyrus oleraceus]|uniref:Uncharacterized protein n=1 Tax=Pisum sativum TaxID=3888 RepID=A0A9D4YFL7_PEA|nr:hypothetical protein KIW84_023686 [Pisum sativum]
MIYNFYGKYPINFENGDVNNMEVDDVGVGVVESDLVYTLEDLYCGYRKMVNLVTTVSEESRIYNFYGKYPMNFENGDVNNMEVDDVGVGVVESDLVCTLDDLYCGYRKMVNLVRTVSDESG